jgi:putative transposase
VGGSSPAPTTLLLNRNRDSLDLDACIVTWQTCLEIPRTARVVAVGVPHHVTQRGNNRQQIFFSDLHRQLYLALPAEHAGSNRLRILGYCLMPNHVHAIVVPETQLSMAQGLGRAHNAYSRFFDQSRRRSGHLWQNRFYSAPLDRAHLTAALRYVDLNPVRARLADEAVAYRWSSAEAHVTGRDRFGLVDADRWRQICPDDDWLEMLQPARGVDEDWAERLRAATRADMPMGSQELIQGLELERGSTLLFRGPGRPPDVHAKGAAASEKSRL